MKTSLIFKEDIEWFCYNGTSSQLASLNLRSHIYKIKLCDPKSVFQLNYSVFYGPIDGNYTWVAKAE